MQQQQKAHSNTTRISAVCADKTIQWIHLKCTSMDISSRINWVGKAEASISSMRAETAPQQGKQIPQFQSRVRQEAIYSPIPTRDLFRGRIFVLY